ncbi:CD63 antigen, partial [Paramuricea clavata]
MGIGVKVAQALLFAFNFVFVLIGLAGIITGALIRLKYDKYEELTSKDIGGVSILLIALGGIIFIVAFFGCCGAIRKSVIMLTIFIVLMVILLVIEVAAAITAYVYKDKVKDYVGEGMDYALKHYDEKKYKEAFDTVQKEFDCCGKDGVSDYTNPKPYNITTIPDSCCSNLTMVANQKVCTKLNAYQK